MDDRTDGVLILGLRCSVGFYFGYEVHNLRSEWLKRRRERLARKLQETQKQIDLMATTR